jgi:nucleoid DNA-binding protein
MLRRDRQPTQNTPGTAVFPLARLRHAASGRFVAIRGSTCGIGRLISEILDSIGRSLGSGKRAELRGFGSFQVKVRGPRPSRNPEASETIIVAEKKTLQIREARDS